MELFVSTRNGVPDSRSRAMKASAPGSAVSSRTSTPSMSISHERISRRVTPDRLRSARSRAGRGRARARRLAEVRARQRAGAADPDPGDLRDVAGLGDRDGQPHAGAQVALEAPDVPELRRVRDPPGRAAPA